MTKITQKTTLQHRIRPELLAPAGNMECLETALRFGADAVYLAGKRFGLRAFADNFDTESLARAAELAHAAGARIYVTLNALLRENELGEAVAYAHEAHDAGADAFIVSDPALVSLLPDMELHLSTQCSTMNSASVRFWGEQGVSRIVLARELTLEQIAEIYKKTGAELEVFVHGAMCIAYSGRCLLSSVMTGRSGNRGECAQPCRFEYQLSEKGFPGQFFPIMEDERGTYVMNSRDLRMIEHIPELIRAGISSFKIEGRMKGAHYVASVVHAYRRAIDEYMADPQGYRTDAALIEELELSASRRFTTGFFFGDPQAQGQDTTRDAPRRRLTVCGIVREAREGAAIVEQRGKFALGDELRVLSPHTQGERIRVTGIFDALSDAPQMSAPHPQQRIRITGEAALHEGDFLRKVEYY